MCPGTQRGGKHFWETIDEKCEATDSLPSIVCAVQPGTIMLMDGTLLHRGSSHTDKDAPAREVAYDLSRCLEARESLQTILHQITP